MKRFTGMLCAATVSLIPLLAPTLSSTLALPTIPGVSVRQAYAETTREGYSDSKSTDNADNSDSSANKAKKKAEKEKNHQTDNLEGNEKRGEEEEPQPEPVNITDPTLRSLVRDQLMLQPEDELNSDDMLRLTNLVIPANTSVSSLDGLQDAKNLSRLDIQTSSIDSLNPLAQCRQLREINLTSDADQVDISALANMKNLESVNLSGVHASDYQAFQSTKNLTYLSISRVNLQPQIRMLAGALKSLDHLQELHLNNCDLVDIAGLARDVRADIVDLQNNRISDGQALGELKNSRELWLSGNRLTTVAPLAKLTTLRRLYLMGMPNISDIDSLGPLSLDCQISVDTSLTDKLEEAHKIAQQKAKEQALKDAKKKLTPAQIEKRKRQRALAAEKARMESIQGQLDSAGLSVAVTMATVIIVTSVAVLVVSGVRVRKNEKKMR